MVRTRYANYTNEELIRNVAAAKEHTELELEMAQRMADLVDENDSLRTDLGADKARH